MRSGEWMAVVSGGASKLGFVGDWRYVEEGVVGSAAIAVVLDEWPGKRGRPPRLGTSGR